MHEHFLSRVVVVGCFSPVSRRAPEVDAPGKSRESQILPSVREPTSSERETSLITPGFGIEFHPPPPRPEPGDIPANDILRFECGPVGSVRRFSGSRAAKYQKLRHAFSMSFSAPCRGNRSGWRLFKERVLKLAPRARSRRASAERGFIPAK